MKSKHNPLFVIYQWFVAFPLLLVLTIVTAIATTVLSPLLPNSQLSYFPARWWARAFCYLLFVKVKVHGLEYFDKNKSYVIACNHQSIYDIFVVYGWFPMFFKWIMKAELRRIPLVGKACEAAGHIFIDRSHPIAAQHSLERAEAQLKNGVSVVIFPEGTRTYDGKVGKFKKGAFRIASDLGLPVVPVSIKGAFECLPRNSFNVKPGKIDVFIHKPIDIQQYLPYDMPTAINSTREIICSKV